MSATKTRKALAVIVINLVVLEVAAFAAVHALGVLAPNRRLDLFVDARLEDVTDDTLAAYLGGAYDFELGWDNVPNTTVTQRNVLGESWTASYDTAGARRSCLSDDGAPLIATFGDSLTRGDEVDDDSTWQCELERRLGRRVVNHGVGGYDVSQAVFKAQREWSAGHVAPITILGVYTDDLARVLNRYRPYLDGSSAGALGFKPGFRYLNGEVAFLPNPLTPDTTTVAELRELTLSVADTDYWARGWARVLPEFPYSLQVFRTAWYALDSSTGTRHFLINVWNTEEGREVMLHLLREFVAGAKQHDTHPVLLLIPEVNDWGQGRTAPDYDNFVRERLTAEHLDLTVIDLAARPFDEARFSLKPFEGHASRYGNGVVADAVLEGVGSLLPDAPEAAHRP